MSENGFVQHSVSHSPRNAFSSQKIVTEIWSQTHKKYTLKTHIEALQIKKDSRGRSPKPPKRGNYTCDTSRIMQEAPEFEPYLPHSHAGNAISRILNFAIMIFSQATILRRSAHTFSSCRQLNATGNGQIIIIYMVSYCAWNKHNNLSSRAFVWHAYHHDVLAYIL